MRVVTSALPQPSTKLGNPRLALLEPASRNDLIGVYGGELFPKEPPHLVQDLTIDNAAGSWRACVFFTLRLCALSSATDSECDLVGTWQMRILS